MRIEDFIKMFGGICPSEIVQEQLDYIKKVNAVIENKQKSYINTLEKKDRSIGPQAQADDNEPNITPLDYMFLKTIYYKQMINAFFHLGTDNKINPLTLFVPDVFQKDNKIEALQAFGNAYDKSLLLNWPYYRQFFKHERPFKYSTQVFMKKVLDACEPEKIAQTMRPSKEFCENYDSIENLLKYKDTGIYYSSRVEYKMTILTELITQVLQREDQDTVRATMQVLYSWLKQMPLIIFELCTDALYYVVSLLDMERCDFINPSGEKIELELTLEVPKAIISQMNDPMKSQEFRKMGREDEHTTQGKVSQYNDLVDSLPLWDILDQVKYKTNVERRQKEINEIDNLVKQGKMTEEVK